MSRHTWARKLSALRMAETDGEVADSLDVRLALLARVKSGELTLEESKKELRRIQRGAKKRGLKTRSQIYRDA